MFRSHCTFDRDPRIVILWRLTLNDTVSDRGRRPMSLVRRSPRERRQELLRAERSILAPRPHGRYRIAVGYPNSYHVAQSSLAFQWIVELASRSSDISVERFVAEPGLDGVTLETGADLGSADVLAWTYSFELDGVNILRTLDAAGIARRSEQRPDESPLVVVGGPVATINPLVLSPAVDVFFLGAAERLWPEFLSRFSRIPRRQELLDTLSGLDGFFVPSRHLDNEGIPLRRIRRLEKRDAHMSRAEWIPASHVVSPHTEYSNRALIEMSRGCPEKCKYCWISFNSGRLRCYTKKAILDRVGALKDLTDRIGFVATAVGDHPDLASILENCADLRMDVSISSLRIPAMRREVLEPLAACGMRSVTLAPETGSTHLRERMGKPIPNERILDAVELAQECDIPGLKLYFIIGLPDETEDDVIAIAQLTRAARAIMDRSGRPRGRTAPLHVGVSILVPKPYTPFGRAPMIEARVARKKARALARALTAVPNTRFSIASYRESLWQSFLSRGTTQSFDALNRVADGESIAEVLRAHEDAAERSRQAVIEAQPVWQFIASAPRTISGLEERP